MPVASRAALLLSLVAPVASFVAGPALPRASLASRAAGIPPIVQPSMLIDSTSVDLLSASDVFSTTASLLAKTKGDEIIEEIFFFFPDRTNWAGARVLRRGVCQDRQAAGERVGGAGGLACAV